MARVGTFDSLLSANRRLALDTSIFIYLFEKHSQYEHLCGIVFDRLGDGQNQAVVSSIAVSEVLLQPMKQENAKIVALYEHVFHSLPNFSLVDIDYSVAKAAAALRAQYDIRIADALHIACAMRGSADVFLTNDRRLKRVSDIAIACLSDYV